MMRSILRTASRPKIGKARYDRFNGQSKAEYLKNFQRIRDIITKSGGDVQVQKRLAQVQANRITDEDKALNRAMAAKEIAGESSEIFEVFFNRAYELGKVGTQEYRDYKLSKLID